MFACPRRAGSDGRRHGGASSRAVPGAGGARATEPAPLHVRDIKHQEGRTPKLSSNFNIFMEMPLYVIRIPTIINQPGKLTDWEIHWQVSWKR